MHSYESTLTCPTNQFAKARLLQAIWLAHGLRLFYPLPASSAHRHIPVVTHAHATVTMEVCHLPHTAAQSWATKVRSYQPPRQTIVNMLTRVSQVPNDKVPWEA